MHGHKYSYTTWVVFVLWLATAYGISGCAEDSAEGVDENKIGVLFVAAGMEGDFQEPHREHWLKLIYGNDVPDYYGYEQDGLEAFNIKDELTALFLEQYPDKELAFRHGFEAKMEKADEEGILDSTERAIEELIGVEQVDRIVVVSSRSHLSNQNAFGECWVDANGQGVSLLLGNTYKECVNDVTNGIGPADQDTLDALLEEHPWEDTKALFPQITHLIQAVDPSMKSTFATSFGKYPEFAEAIGDLFDAARDKYQIPGDVTITVAVATEGPADGYADEGACDLYGREANAVATFAADKLKSNLASSWMGEFGVTKGEIERAQPTEAKNYDPPSLEAPQGDIMSVGEVVDISVNGSYVSGTGQKWDGTGATAYVIVLPVSTVYDNESTLMALRQHSLGNHELVIVETEERWVRQTDDSDGTPYDEEDYDDEYCTVKEMDASGWASIPEGYADPIPKGDRFSPTTVLLAGTVLSAGNVNAKRRVAEAMIASIMEAVAVPNLNGKLNTACEESR